jgi:hypothetical protein
MTALAVTSAVAKAICLVICSSGFNSRAERAVPAADTFASSPPEPCSTSVADDMEELDSAAADIWRRADDADDVSTGNTCCSSMNVDDVGCCVGKSAQTTTNLLQPVCDER